VLIAAVCAQAEPRLVRRAGVVLFALTLPLCAFAALFAPEVRGAARWIVIGPVTFQPSEVMKPALVIVWAWMLSEGLRHRRFPGAQICAGLYALAALALVVQPDLGQAALLGGVLVAMLVLGGVRLRWLMLAAGAGVGAAVAAFAVFPHARVRWIAFLNPDDPGYQVGRSLDAIASGGLFGRGPGEGVIKAKLPDAHADFVYAVAAEEFGVFASFGLAALFAAFAFRGLSRASRLVEPFEQLAAAGLTTLIVLQAAIHVAVNVSLAPAKGMTLPLVSYGGSSMIGTAIALGFILALTRRRPGAFVYETGAP
jgi:cell division protein FtsW